MSHRRTDGRTHIHLDSLGSCPSLKGSLQKSVKLLTPPTYLEASLIAQNAQEFLCGQYLIALEDKLSQKATMKTTLSERKKNKY